MNQITVLKQPLVKSVVPLLALLLFWLLPATALAQGPNDAPVVGTNTVLYDGMLGGTVSDQGNFSYVTIDPLNGSQSTQTVVGDVTVLDTTTDTNDYAGYSHIGTVLNRDTGYTIKFNAQLVSESHTNNDRAGFSIIALSSDLQGIEIGFWEDEIWAQEGGTSPNLFTHAEGVTPTFSITDTLIPYELTVLSDTYSLSISHTEILSGLLRDYTAWVPNPAYFPDIYEFSNFIFLGDDTTSASAEVRLGYVSVITNVVPPDRSVDSGQPLAINDIGLLDVDGYGGTQVVTLTVSHGTLDISDSVPGGLTAANISGNGSKQLVLTGPVGQINSSLVYSPALTYTSLAGFVGSDTLTTTVNDQGNSGSGGPLPLSDSKSFNIEIQGTPRCFASLGNTTEYSSTNALAVQQAVDAAADNQLVKVAGYCAGVNTRAGLNQSVYISKSLTVRGGYTTTNWSTPDFAGQPTTIDAEADGRVVYVTEGVSVTLEGLLLTGGEASSLGGSLPGYDAGGGIWNGGNLTVSRSQIFSNNVDAECPAYGGGIYTGGNLTVTNSIIRDNQSRASGGECEDLPAAYGGGIAGEWGESPQKPTVIIRQSVISGNTVQGASVFNGYGGGLFTRNIELYILQSTVSGNKAIGGDSGQSIPGSGLGGGVYVDGGAAYIANSTLSSNSADGGSGDPSSGEGYGGGIYNSHSPFYSSTVYITNTTVASNTASTAGGNLIDAYQEGIPPPPPQTIYLANSIVAHGVAESNANCAEIGSGSIVSNGHNLEDANTCNLTATGDITNTNPLLGPLTDNGGPATASGEAAYTHALPAGSLAIDAADSAICAAAPINNVDQRGVTRPQGSGCDIGAFELPAVTISSTLAPEFAVNIVGDSHTVTATIYADEQPVGPGQTVTFTVSGAHPGLGTANTDVNGQAVFSYTGTVAGSDTITASGVVSGVSFVSPSVSKEWIVLTATLVPTTALNPINTSHTVTGTILVNNEPPILESETGLVVTFTVTGVNNRAPVTRTVSQLDGTVTFSYTGTASGTDTIRMSGTYQGAAFSTAVSKIWFVAGVSLTPAEATNPLSTSHTVTATVTVNDNPVGAGVPLTFTITAGPHLGLDESTETDANGQATFSYTGTITGSDTIRVSGIISGVPFSNTAVKNWIVEETKFIYLPIIIKSPPTFEVPQ